MFQKGDFEAFGYLMERHQGKIIATVYLLATKCSSNKPSLESIKDAGQEMARKIIEEHTKHANLEILNFSTWATQYCFNIWRNQQQKDLHRLQLRGEKLLPEIQHYEIELLLNRALDRQKMFSYIVEIENELYREIVYLVFEKSYNADDLAKRFSKDKKWVADKKYRAIKAYRKILVANGFGNDE